MSQAHLRLILILYLILQLSILSVTFVNVLIKFLLELLSTFTKLLEVKLVSFLILVIQFLNKCFRLQIFLQANDISTHFAGLLCEYFYISTELLNFKLEVSCKNRNRSVELPKIIFDLIFFFEDTQLGVSQSRHVYYTLLGWGGALFGALRGCCIGLVES